MTAFIKSPKSILAKRRIQPHQKNPIMNHQNPHPFERGLVAAALLLAACSGVHAAETNLLTVNPSFEDAAFSTFKNGDYEFVGWKGKNYLYNVNAVQDGSATDGKRRFHIDWGGMLATAVANRPAAMPGTMYEMRYDLRTLVGKFPDEWLGTRSFLEFYDADGNLVKQYWGPDWLPQSQAQGEHDWETIAVRGVAPVGAATMGVRIDAPSGMFYSADKNRTQNRNVEVDNFRLVAVPETSDRIAIRRAPRLVEPGKTATLKVLYAATAPRALTVRLVNKANAVIAQKDTAVTAGRGLDAIDVPMPANLAAGDYIWEIGLVPQGKKWSDALGVKKSSGVISDESVNVPKDGVASADDPRIVYMGRFEESDPKKRGMNWYGSEVRLRFNGTSLTLVGSCGDNGYGGPNPAKMEVVIDGDATKVLKVAVGKTNAHSKFPLVTGLADGVHTATLFKAAETDQHVWVEGFSFDPGRGLLRPEPLSSRKIEIFGDSVTSGGNADPHWLSYAPLLGRELDADVHIISKGGTGVAASWIHMVTLLKYWDKLTFTNVFNVEKAQPWDFTKWTPDAVVIAIGHNDQFNGGGGIFAQKYRDFHDALRQVYPRAHILAGNTVISTPVGHYSGAIMPLIAEDPNMSFAWQWTASATVGGHPNTEMHGAMVTGAARVYSMADVLEEKLDWGLDPVPVKASASKPAH
jgi:lysophospholipase L1-like esterase